MIYFWLNGALCLRYENEEEHECLKTLYYSIEKGLKPHPDRDLPNTGDSDDKNPGCSRCSEKTKSD